jgi:hypothetical protein
MILERHGDDRLTFRDPPGPLVRWAGLGLGAIALAVLLFGQSLVAGLVVVVATAALWLAVRHADVGTEATFDRRRGSYRIRQVSLGKPQFELNGTLLEIEGVVVQATGSGRKGRETLALRPALLVGGDLLPLTFGRYAQGEEPRRIALALRRFLGLPTRGLIDDSIRAAARDPYRLRPAIRLARLGKGLEPDAAAAYVARVKAEQDAEQDEPSGP